jgi:hypothetical protein
MTDGCRPRQYDGSAGGGPPAVGASIIGASTGRGAASLFGIALRISSGIDMS